MHNIMLSCSQIFIITTILVLASACDVYLNSDLIRKAELF